MADLIAIGYDDEETAAKAAEEVYRLAHDLLIEPQAVAVISRDKNGKYKVTTNHHPVAQGATWGMLWGALFGLLFFVPVFGLAIGGAFGALFGAIDKLGIDKGFQEEVRDMVAPGTSALFLIVEKVTPDKAIEALSTYGGHVLKTSLSRDAEGQLQRALEGGDGSSTSAPEPASAAATS
jgi:uncharacterized membrane protein